MGEFWLAFFLFLFFFLRLKGLYAFAQVAKYLSLRLPVLVRNGLDGATSDDVFEDGDEIEDVVKERANEGHLDACGWFSTTDMLMYSTMTSVRGSAKWDQKSMMLLKKIKKGWLKNGSIIDGDHATP